MLTVEEKIAESNRIEGITRPPTNAEIEEFHKFLGLKQVTPEDLAIFVRVYQPNAKMRTEHGMDVQVGGHVPIRGGPKVLEELQHIVDMANKHPQDAFIIHLKYEMLHPFMDGNGRSGRMLWYWCMEKSGQRRLADLGFLQAFYYQTLRESQ